MRQLELFIKPEPFSAECSFWCAGVLDNDRSSKITIEGLSHEEVLDVRDYIMNAMRFYSQRDQS